MSVAAQSGSQSVMVHLCRHGLVHNPQKLFYGRLPGFGLAAAGREQAALLGDFLAAQPAGEVPSKVISSPLQRAMETASIVRDKLSLREENCFIDEEPGVLEVDSPFEGQTLEFMHSVGWAIYEPAALQSIGAHEPCETFAELGARAIEALQRQAQKAMADGHESVVIASHGDVCCAVRLWAAGVVLNTKTRAEYYASGGVSYCGVVSIRVNEHGDCVEHSVKDWDNLGAGGKKA